MSHTVTLKGNSIRVEGDFLQVGDPAPNLTLTANDLSELSLKDFSGQRKVLNIFPSIDTATCATSVRQFNQHAAKLDNTLVLCISADLPFAQSRFCGSEGLEQVKTLSSFRHPEFAQDWGVAIAEGPLRGLTARAVVVLDEQDKVIHAECVAEIAQEPDYQAALAVL